MAEKKTINYLVGKHSFGASTRQSMVSRKFDMSNAMTVLANWNKVANRAVLSDAVNVVDNKNFWSNIVSAVVAPFFKDSPSVSSVTPGFLRLKRLFSPVFNATFVAAVFSSAGVFFNSRFCKPELLIAGNAVSLFKTIFINSYLSIKYSGLPLVLVGTTAATEVLFVRMALLGDKLNSALLACVDCGGVRFALKFFNTQMMTVNKVCAGIFGKFSTPAAAEFRLFPNFVFVGVCHV